MDFWKTGFEEVAKEEDGLEKTGFADWKLEGECAELKAGKEEEEFPLPFPLALGSMHSLQRCVSDAQIEHCKVRPSDPLGLVLPPFPPLKPVL